MTRELSHAHLAEIATDILNEPVLGVCPAFGGGNNSIFKIKCSNGSYALKFYPAQREDTRDRLGQEYGAIEFLTSHGIDDIPAPIGFKTAERCALYQWIEGERVTDIGVAEIDSLAGFLEKLQPLRNAKGVEQIQSASASCLSPSDVAQQLLSRLDAIENAPHGSAELETFLTQDIRPSIQMSVEGLYDKCVTRGVDYETPLRRQNQALSPSDFGFHNALRDDSGRIIFLDFEYFGWDDPAKMISDVRYHAGMNLSVELGEHFQAHVSRYFASSDSTLPSRLKLVSPLFGLIWCLILLNEFLPERWARRKAAGHENVEASRQRQLGKAKTLFRRINL